MMKIQMTDGSLCGELNTLPGNSINLSHTGSSSRLSADTKIKMHAKGEILYMASSCGQAEYQNNALQKTHKCT